MKHVRLAVICSRYTDYVELLFTNLVTNTSRGKGKKNSLTSRRQRFKCQTFTNTHSHIPTSHFRVLYMLFSGHNWVLYSPTLHKKQKQNKKPPKLKKNKHQKPHPKSFYPPPWSRKPPTPNIQSVHPTVMLYSYRACSDVTSSFFIGMATGRQMGFS